MSTKDLSCLLYGKYISLHIATNSPIAQQMGETFLRSKWKSRRAKNMFLKFSFLSADTYFRPIMFVFFKIIQIFFSVRKKCTELICKNFRRILRGFKMHSKKLTINKTSLQLVSRSVEQVPLLRGLEMAAKSLWCHG